MRKCISRDQTLSNPKLTHLLVRLSDSYFGPKTERVVVQGPLTVEHILPQNWVAEWPLPDGTAGLTPEELGDAPPGDPRADASLRRNGLLQTIGNLTVITQPLNSAVSNGPWKAKKPALLTASLMPINQQLYLVEVWDEAAIEARSDALYERAAKIWPGPG